MLSCPSQRATLRISPVACSVFKAQVCRRTCGDSRLVFKGGHLLTAAGMCLLRICLKPERVRGWARIEEQFRNARVASNGKPCSQAACNSFPEGKDALLPPFSHHMDIDIARAKCHIAEFESD